MKTPSPWWLVALSLGCREQPPPSITADPIDSTSPPDDVSHTLDSTAEVRFFLDRIDVSACVTERLGDSDIALTLGADGSVTSTVTNASVGHDIACLESKIRFRVTLGASGPTTFRVIASARALGYGPVRYESSVTLRLFEDAVDAGLKPPFLRARKL